MSCSCSCLLVRSVVARTVVARTVVARTANAPLACALRRPANRVCLCVRRCVCLCQPVYVRQQAGHYRVPLAPVCISFLRRAAFRVLPSSRCSFSFLSSISNSRLLPPSSVLLPLRVFFVMAVVPPLSTTSSCLTCAVLCCAVLLHGGAVSVTTLCLSICLCSITSCVSTASPSAPFVLTCLY
jgi:hypothetical protein